MNLTEGSPVLYRGVEVGTVRKFELNSLGDRVLVHIAITPKYQHLVRKNSEFWVSSGYDFNLGWKGAEFNTGSVQQFVERGHFVLDSIGYDRSTASNGKSAFYVASEETS